jgi:hypothetical protein
MKQIKKMMMMVLMLTLAGCGCRDNHGDDDDADIDAPAVVIDAPPDGPKSYAPCEGCCDPINQTGCATGQACYHHATGPDAGRTYCDTMGTAPYGGNCFVDTDCSAGTGCFNGKCIKFCTVAAECAPIHNNCFPAQDPFIYGVCS